jgi:hypothetical protein
VLPLQEHEAATYAFLAHAYKSVPFNTLVRYALLAHRVLASSVPGLKPAAAAAAPAAQAPESAAEGGGDEDAGADGDEGAEDEDAGFARSGKKGGKGKAAAAAAAAAKKTKRDRAGNAKQAAAASSAAAAAPPAPPTASLKLLAALARCLAILMSTIAPVLAASAAAAEAAAKAAARKRRAAKGGAKKSGDADDDAAADALVDPLTGGPSPGAAVDEHADSRDRIRVALGGDAIADLLAALTVAAPAAGAAEDEGTALARAAITSSLLSVAGALPPSVVGTVGLAESLWKRLGALAPSEAGVALPGILQCLTAWGKAGELVAAATAAVSAAAAPGGGGAAPSGGSMHPAVAVLVLEAVTAMAAQPGAAVAVEAAAIEGAMAALSAGAQALVPALLQPPGAASTDATSDARCALAVACARAWCGMLLHTLTITAEVAGGPATAAVATQAVAGQAKWAGDALVKAAVTRADALAAAGAAEDADAPLATARAVLALLAAGVGDLAGVGLACEPAVGLLEALTSDVAPPHGDGYASLTPLELCCAVRASGDADGDAATSPPHQALPAAVLRLSLRLHAVACGNVTTTATAAASSAQPVVLPPGARTRVWHALARAIVTMGSAAAASAGAPAAAAAPVLRAAWSAALTECAAGGAALLSGSARGFTSDFLCAVLPEVESAVPDAGPAAAAVAAGGAAGAVAASHAAAAEEDDDGDDAQGGDASSSVRLRPDSLGCPAAAALVAVCTGDSGAAGGGRGKAAAAGMAATLPAALAQALALRWATLGAVGAGGGGGNSSSDTLPFRALAATFAACLPPPNTAAARSVRATLETVLGPAGVEGEDEGGTE